MTPQEASVKSREICELAPVVPVLVVEDAAHAAPLAKALVAGGLPALEVTLRTPAALDVIKAMSQVEGGVVGAGTLVTPEDVRAAKAAGARFGVFRPARRMRCCKPAKTKICRCCPAPRPHPRRCGCWNVGMTC